MAGAGVSAGWPAAVPSWNPLNESIFHALRGRLAAGMEKPGVLEPLESSVTDAREGEQFPPDYQAQLIEEMCGIRYFQGLQALDIEHGNAAHEAIAALAAGGALRAVVTTNFDRLIERSLERRGIAFTPAFDEAGFAALTGARDGPLPVIKVHGCVSSPESMVDTWKQRCRGRSQALIESWRRCTTRSGCTPASPRPTSTTTTPTSGSWRARSEARARSTSGSPATRPGPRPGSPETRRRLRRPGRRADRRRR